MRLTEYFCECCKIVFYAEYGVVERCLKCGSTSEVNMMRTVEATFKKDDIMKTEYIPFNIWDDYHDDGYVPEGDTQKTYGYVEEYDDITEDEKELISEVIYNYIKTLDMTGVVFKKAGEDIDFEHLTHERREKLIKELQSSGLQFNGIPINFYSES